MREASEPKAIDDPQKARWLCLRLALLAALPALLLVDTALALAGGWTILSGSSAVVACAALALVGTFLIAGLRAGRLFLDRHGNALVYVVYSAAGAWLAAEVLVGAYVWLSSGVLPFSPFRYHLRQPQAHWVSDPDASIIPGIEGVSNYTTNSLGIRGPDLPPRDSAYRILAIGGSTTENQYLDDSETWPHLLMKRLNQEQERKNVWVGSVGISGYTTAHHVRFIEESTLVQEMDALVLLIGANDLTWFLRNPFWEDGLFARPIWHRSPIVNLARGLWHRRLKNTYEAEDPHGRNYQNRRLRRQQGTIQNELPDTTAALQRYQARIEAIVQIARRHGVRPIFITQPTLWDENLDERGRSLLWLGDTAEEDEYLSVEAGRAGIDKYNEALRSMCKRLDAECIDTDSMHGQVRYYYDDFHFTEIGSHELARLVSEHFLAHSSRSSTVDDREGVISGRRGEIPVRIEFRGFQPA